MIDASKLNQRINIEQRGSGCDAIGQPIETWELVSAVWASIRYPSGVSSIKSGADVSIVKASVRIRYRAGINSGMRVTAGGHVFDIQAVLPNRIEGYTDLVCERIE